MNLIMWARSSSFRAAAAYGHVAPDGYPPEREEGEPDELCLSRANDRDFEEQVLRRGLQLELPPAPACACAAKTRPVL